ncbi:MAG: hypothetical protein ACO1SV_00175 [Fimbriimonas sp.]
MAFEPLQTDETLDEAAPKVRDTDTVMLFGCGAFVAGSLTVYFLSIWPFLAWSDVQRLRTLAMCVGAGLAPTVVFTAIMSRRFGLPGACGAIGGALTTAVFLYLRLQQAFTAAAARQDKPPDYPASLQTLVPLVWVLAVALVGVLLLSKEEFSSSEE